MKLGRKLGRIALRNLFRNGRRSLLSMLAVAVAAMSITLLFSLYAGILNDIRFNAWGFETGEVRLRHADYDRYEHLNPVQYVVPDYRQLTEKLRERPDVAGVSPRINVPALLFIGERQIAAYGMGIDFELEQEYQDLDALLVKGELPRPGSSDAVLAYGLARELGVDVGDTATFLTQTRVRSSNAFSVDVSGIVAFGTAAMNRRVFMMPIENAERYLRMAGGATEILVIGNDNSAGRAAGGDKGGKNGSENGGDNGLSSSWFTEFFTTWDDSRGIYLAGALNSWLDAEAEATDRKEWGQVRAVPWNESSSGYLFSRFAGVIYNIVALFFFLLAGTVIINTTMMIINERTHEIGTLSAMGMGRGELVRLFFIESALLGVAGSFLGGAVGVLLVLPLQQMGLDLGARIDMVDMNISSVIYPMVHLRFVVWVFVYSAAVAMVTSLFPALRAARLKPVDALRA